MKSSILKLITQKLSNPMLIEKAKTFNNVGIVKQWDNYSFLKVDDGFIHNLYPYLNNSNIRKPDYFTPPQITGAHISIIFPEENTTIKVEDLEQTHTFKVNELIKVSISLEDYYVLMVTCPSLTKLRRRYGLPAKPKYLDNSFDFHVTIGVGIG